MQPSLPQQPAQAQAQAWEQFLAVLEAERSALVANDGERVAALAAQKADLAQMLAHSPACAPAGIRALALKARELNQVNGALLLQRLAQTRQALALLRPGAGANASDVYGPDGRSARRTPANRGSTLA
jgi:flagellar biosynthesis/type III secretory pathway chaperone